MSDFIDGDYELDPFDPELAEQAENATYEGVKDAELAVRAHIQRTKEAYVRVFKSGNPTQDDLDFLMRDLTWFCKMDEHFFSDARVQDLYAGRKQTMQRIIEYATLDFDTLIKRYIETQKG